MFGRMTLRGNSLAPEGERPAHPHHPCFPDGGPVLPDDWRARDWRCGVATTVAPPVGWGAFSPIVSVWTPYSTPRAAMAPFLPMPEGRGILGGFR
jgi:hypothetical protein